VEPVVHFDSPSDIPSSLGTSLSGSPRPPGAGGVAVAAIFVGLVTLLYAGQRARVFSATNPARYRTVSASARPPASAAPSHRTFSAPLTDEDAARLRALPPQDQAEELLERSLAHDERARQMLDDNVGEWTGHLRRTPRLSRLDARAQYSTDLRVRFSDAALCLALEGWHRNEESAGLLTSRAQGDPKYRAYAVYYLGMLAGQGVAYDRIHSVLLNYALEDSDAAVRQWAVEGLRFLRKDEVLDELFASFTHDASLSVRDRAACNLAEGGHFTRAQRMRLVPRLIEVAGDPATTAQMRNWSFLALTEITGQRISPDAAVWAGWYREQGAAKLAQFQSQPWWQVAGDE